MSDYTYKVVPFIGKIKSGQGAEVVSAQLQDIINTYAAEGWDYYELTSSTIQVAPGCFAGLFGASASYISYDQIIFRK